MSGVSNNQRFRWWAVSKKVVRAGREIDKKNDGTETRWELSQLAVQELEGVAFEGDCARDRAGSWRRA
jgi:hypothetical protein